MTDKLAGTMLIVDDEEINRAIIANLFEDEFDIAQAEDGAQGLSEIERLGNSLSAVLLDVIMPGMSGLDVLRRLAEGDFTRRVPVFLITADSSGETMQEAYRLGVMDVIPKPVVPYVVMRRVHSVVELFQARRRLGAQVERQREKLLEQTQQLAQLSMGMVEALATSIEFRSNESGAHVRRIRDITRFLLGNTPLGAGLSSEEIELMGIASITHDVGKISIPDAILNKPGRLTPEEFDVMKTHTVKGAELLASIPQMRSHSSYHYAYDIALHHHERWDGRGYPDGLVGDRTPIWSQVVALADVYDALSNKRCYKDAFPADVVVDMILGGQCGAFNPRLLRCFKDVEPELRQLYLKKEENADG